MIHFSHRTLRALSLRKSFPAFSIVITSATWRWEQYGVLSLYPLFIDAQNLAAEGFKHQCWSFIFRHFTEWSIGRTIALLTTAASLNTWASTRTFCPGGAKIELFLPSPADCRDQTAVRTRPGPEVSLSGALNQLSPSRLVLVLASAAILLLHQTW